jgi:hypothetical protein
MRPKPLMPILTIVCSIEFWSFEGRRPSPAGGHVNHGGKQESGLGFKHFDIRSDFKRLFTKPPGFRSIMT